MYIWAGFVPGPQMARPGWALNVTRRVVSSTASTAVTMSESTKSCQFAVSWKSTAVCQVKAMSSAVSGSPSDHWTSSRSVTSATHESPSCVAAGISASAATSGTSSIPG